MAFPKHEAEELLAACHRRCCLCHRFCGVKIELDHIIPRDDDGNDEIDNAIPLCFECHAEIHAYNPRHPRGRKFRAPELRLHKEEWLRICAERPEVLVRSAGDRDVGPLQALIDELAFNLEVSRGASEDQPGCLFLDHQFLRAMREGAISILQENLREKLLEAYVVTGKANQHILEVQQSRRGTSIWDQPAAAARKASLAACEKVEAAHNGLLGFLGAE